MELFHLSGIRNVVGILGNRRSITGVIALTLLFWTGFTLLVFPEYAVQQIQFGGIGYLDNTISMLLWYQYASSGVAGVVLPAAISILLAISAVYFLTVMRNMTNTLGSGIAGGIGSLSAGCATCGGVLPLLGLTGGLALLPFNGRELQVASIGLLLLSLEYAGRNTTCSIDNGEIL